MQPMAMARWPRRVLATVSAAILGAGCAADVVDSSASVDSSALLSQVPAVGSEVVVTSAVLDAGGRHQLVVGYAGEHPGLITYNNSSQQIFEGASRMSWFRLSPEAGGGSGGRVSPPDKWAALVGEPAVARHRADPKYIYMSNLAVPLGKYPSTGFIAGALDSTTVPADCGSYVGGGCIARSGDDGLSFDLSQEQCVRRITAACPNGTAYTGSDLETSPEGRVYAAFKDSTRVAVDVYMATDPKGDFARVTDPLPIGGIGAPRIKYGPGGLYLLYSTGPVLRLMRYEGGSSYTGAWTAPVTIGAGLTGNAIEFANHRFVEPRNEYDLDIGPSELGGTEVRIVFASFDEVASRRHIRVVRCTTGSPITCTSPAGWYMGSRPGDQFNPAITYVPKNDGTIKWAVSYHDTRTTQALPTGAGLWRATVSANPDQLAPTLQEPGQSPCPSTRGHWSAYDGMAAGPGDGFTFRGLTDSGTGSCTQSTFTSSPVRVSVSSWTQ